MRKVAVFSGDRAERGHVDAILRGIDSDGRLLGELIERRPDAHEDTGIGVAESVGKQVQSISRLLGENPPDVLLVYGDRSETFAAAIAATYVGIPIAHVEGGDVTLGGLPDDSVRGAITSLSKIHFATNEQSACTLRRDHELVYNVGLPILDLGDERLTPDEIRERFDLDYQRPTILFCMHPVPGEEIAPIVDAMRTVADFANVVCLTPNHDAGHTAVRDAIGKHFEIVPNMHQREFHGLLAVASCFVGNSSAALKEAPYFGCPSVDIGRRQMGRLRGDSVLRAELDQGDIERAVIRTLTQERPRQFDSPYNAGAGRAIADVLATVKL